MFVRWLRAMWRARQRRKRIERTRQWLRGLRDVNVQVEAIATLCNIDPTSDEFHRWLHELVKGEVLKAKAAAKARAEIEAMKGPYR